MGRPFLSRTRAFLSAARRRKMNAGGIYG
jgi:hypothetical protein